MSRTKIVVLVMVIVVLTIGLSITNGYSAAKEKITLEFPSWQATEPGFMVWWPEMFAAYEEKHPGVTFDFYQVPYGVYHDTMITRFAAGDPPDIVHLPTSIFPGIAKSGWLEPLDDLLKDTDIEESWVPLQEKLEWEGETLGVLLAGYGYILYYNEKMFQEAGIEVPTTPDELLEAAKALTKDTDGDGRIDQYGIGLPTITCPGVFSKVSQFVLGTGAKFAEAGKITVNSPGVVKALDLFDKITPYSPMGVTDVVQRQLFFEGQTAMIMDGPWVLGMKEKAPPKVKPYVKVAPVPFPIIVGGPSHSIHIPKGINEDKRDLIWEYIYLVTRPQWQYRYSELSGAPPGRKGSIAVEVHPQLELFAEEAAKAVSYWPEGFEAEYSEFSKLVIDAVIRIQTTDEPTKEVLDDLQEQLEKVFGG